MALQKQVIPTTIICFQNNVSQLLAHVTGGALGGLFLVCYFMMVILVHYH